MPSQSFKLSIPKPCTQRWEEMQPVNNGRHCLSCNKKVIDFSVMDDLQVQHYFSNLETGICGRFKQTQLDRIRVQIPSYIFNKPIAAWKKYLVILLVCFGSSLLSVDVALGNTASSTSFVQGTPEPQATQQKKKSTKKKKKKTRSRKIEYMSINDFPTVMGFTPSLREHTLDLFPPVRSDDQNNTKIKGLPTGSLEDKKETPPNKKDNTPAAFIIPAALYRRRKNKLPGIK